MEEPDVFRDFVAARSRALLRTAWLLTGDWTSAQDLVQTALAKTWPAWPRITRTDDPEVYVRRVLVTTYATWWRRRWHGETPVGQLPERLVPDAYDAADRRTVVAAALARLTRGQRARPRSPAHIGIPGLAGGSPEREGRRGGAMSGTELGRLMDEVTAQPPVDVDFGAVEQLVRRRRARTGAFAWGAAAAAVAMIVAVPALGGRPGLVHQTHLPATPGAGTTGLRQDSWNTLRWSVPSDWPASDAYPDHSRPSNAFIDGPYLGSTRVPLSPPTPRATQGSGVLTSAGPILPEGAVVGWFSYGLRSDPLAGDSFDADAVRYLPARCAAMGASQTFHAVRQFGTPTAGSNLSLNGCINAADPTLQLAQLRAILRSVTDSAFPAPPTPSSTSLSLGDPSTGRAAALCQAALGGFATATLTTIAEIHSIEGGPRTPDNPHAHVFPNIFKDAAPSDSAAWCWTRTADGKGYEAWLVHAGDPPHHTGAESLGLTGPPPSGAPGYA